MGRWGTPCLYYPPNHKISNLGSVARAQRAHREQLVDLLHGAGNGGNNVCAAGVRVVDEVGAVAAHPLGVRSDGFAGGDDADALALGGGRARHVGVAVRVGGVRAHGLVVEGRAKGFDGRWGEDRD